MPSLLAQLLVGFIDGMYKNPSEYVQSHCYRVGNPSHHNILGFGGVTHHKTYFPSTGYFDSVASPRHMTKTDWLQNKPGHLVLFPDLICIDSNLNLRLESESNRWIITIVLFN